MTLFCRGTMLAVITAGLVAIDQYTKGLVEARFRLGESVPVIHGFFSLTYYRNSGAAFGIFNNAHGVWVQRGFVGFTIMAIVLIVVIYRAMPADERVGRLSLVLIWSGALGNLVDRAQYGSVTDFLLFYIGRYEWPAFNVADSLITVGAILLAYTIAFHKPDTHQQTADRHCE